MSKKKPKPAGEPRVYVTFWLTRDSDPETGVPGAFVDVWWSRPVRFTNYRGAFWLDRDHRDAERMERWPIAFARSVGACPDDDVQCIRVGPESASRDALSTVKAGEA
jgi:hypothetical protein